MDSQAWLTTEITPEQMQTIDDTNEPLLDAALCTDNMNPDVACAAISAVYAARDLPPPEYVLCTSPVDALQKIDAEAPEEKQGEALYGEAVDMLFHGESSDVHRATAMQSEWTHKMGRRVERALFPVKQLAHALNEAIDADFEDKPIYWVFYAGAYWNLWDDAMELASDEAGVRMGVVAPGRFSSRRALGCAALQTCGGVFAFERKCFVYDRPASIAHPKLTKDAEPGMVRLHWRDGYSCEMEM